MAEDVYDETLAFGCNTCGVPIVFPGFCSEHGNEDNRFVTVSQGHMQRLLGRVAELEAAIENYLLWQPGRRGHAAAHRELQAALKGSDHA